MIAKPLKVMIVMSLAEQKGGGELMLVHLMEHGRNAGIEWQVVFLQDGPMVQQIRDFGVEVQVIEAGRLRQPHKILGTIWKLRRLAKANQIDLIFSWMHKPHLYGGPAAMLCGKPAMWYQLGTPRRSSLLDWLAHLIPAKAIISCGPEGLEQQTKFWPRRPGRLVLPGVELDRFDPSKLPSAAEARRLLNLPTTGPIIGIVGRMQTWKGMHVLVQAMPAILAKHADAHCLIIGGKHDPEPNYPEFLAETIRSHGVEKRVILAGLQKNIPVWVAAMDVFVHASDHEPFGLVVLEGMAMGKPVVAGSEGGPRFIITHGENGLLAPYGNAPELARAVLTYLDDPASAAKIAQAGQQRAREFSTDRYAQNLCQAIKELTGIAASTQAEPLAQLSGQNVR